MSALIIALVCLILMAIVVVTRLLVVELGKPRVQQRKVIEKRVEVEKIVYLSAAGTAIADGAAAIAAGTAIASSQPPVRGATATAVLDRPTPGPSRPRPTSERPPRRDDDLYGHPGRQRRVRMRDVVERGEGVRISLWRRARSLVSLVILVLVLGASAAAVVGALVLFMGFALSSALG